MAQFLDFMDMINGGGAGAGGNKFEGGGILSSIANSLFSPRLSHLSNLSAANVSPTAGLLGAAAAQEQQALPFQKFLRGLFE